MLRKIFEKLLSKKTEIVKQKPDENECKDYECKDCKLKVESKNNLRGHVCNTEEIKSRTCPCKRVCQSKQGLLTHKRSCKIVKEERTREPSTTGDTNENNMMQIMAQMVQQIQNNKESNKLQLENQNRFVRILEGRQASIADPK